MKRPCNSEPVLCDLCGLAEEAIEATGMRAWSIIDPAVGTITLHVEFPPVLDAWRTRDSAKAQG